jgi:hypothetical protein
LRASGIRAFYGKPADHRPRGFAAGAVIGAVHLLDNIIKNRIDMLSNAIWIEHVRVFKVRRLPVFTSPRVQGVHASLSSI